MKLTNKDIFKRRMQSKIIFLLSVIVLYTVSSMISGFENGLAFLSVPKGVLWLFQKFIQVREKRIRFVRKNYQKIN